MNDNQPRDYALYDEREHQQAEDVCVTGEAWCLVAGVVAALVVILLLYAGQPR